MIKKQNRKSMMKTIENGQTNLFAVGSIINQAKIMGQRNLHSFFHHPLPLCQKKRAPLGKLPVSSQPLPRQLHARCQTSRSDVRMHRKRNDSKIGSLIQSLIHPFNPFYVSFIRSFISCLHILNFVIPSRVP